MANSTDNTNRYLLEQSQLDRYCSTLEDRRCPGDRVFKKSTDLTASEPSRTWVLMDEREDSIADAYFAVNMTGYPDAPRTIIWANYAASYHGNSAGPAFADGHSEIKRWRDLRTMLALAPGQWLRLGVSSPNNDDLVWLQEHTTAKE